ncbi:rhamnogalacturonan lyase family protein [Halococcoides cellulosivorans]|uniref:PKD domain containing protein n=1 Tax=Halococcoides cellulosivorans TaxID=1679096 RepID=A0A2R4WZ90_9EURY|nr:RICIN domain-containing protein [Halococcoides cellulosivorans]AWB26859.1 PKD domain containing protein [Halococcoides cellulosivorans]
MREGNSSPDVDVSRRTVLKGLAATGAAGIVPATASAQSSAPRQVENLDRGVVAVPSGDGILVRWRLFGTDPDDLGFHVYRNGEQVNDSPITGSTNFHDAGGSPGDAYMIETEDGEQSKSVEAWENDYIDIPLHERPGSQYHPNDASVGDLTGNGRYDIVVQWYPDNAQDNAFEGHTDPTVFEAVTLEGETLWQIDLGPNIRSGAHYAQWLVYDFDGDGISEFVVRTADGTVDGEGSVIGDPNADWMNGEGRSLEGPEYLTVFDGTTGAEITTTDFEPARGDICSWGDCYGNRGERFLAGVAYLDGEHPSIVEARGYYERSALAAFDFDGENLTQRWHFDSADGWGDYASQGNHQLSVADCDGDGYDEIVYGQCVIDHDGTGLHTTGWGHGDALHVGDFAPDREGLEIFGPGETGNMGEAMRDAETGEPLWFSGESGDVGRGVAGNIDPSNYGAEAWSSADNGLRDAETGDPVGSTPGPKNHLVWWKGDLKRELLDGTWIGEWDPNDDTTHTVEDFGGVGSNNGSKANPSLTADILGDWREEVLLRRDDNEALRLFATPYETDHRIYTLMHDPMYRCAIAWQNVAYNQPPHPSFYIGNGMDEPPAQNIQPIGSDPTDRIFGLPSVPNVPDDTYQLVNVNSGHVLSVASGSESDGADVVQASDSDASAQQWDLAYAGNGQYDLLAAHSGKALDVSGSSEEDGANVQQYAPSANANQRWYLDPRGDGTYRIVAAHSEKVLEISEQSTADGATAQQWTWNGGDHQRWELVPTQSWAGAGPITIDGGGADIWGTADAGHMYAGQVTGDFDVVVRVANVEDTDAFAKAGLMVRAGMDAGAANAMIRRTPSQTSLQWRPEAGAESVSLTSGATAESEVTGGTTDHTVQRLMRSGDELRAYTSADGEEWTLLATVSMSLPEEVMVGLAVTSHSAGTLATAEFEKFAGVDPTLNQDIGTVEAAGSVTDDSTDLDPVDGRVPRDLDGDGIHEDINGNGKLDFPDVNAFFQHSDRPVLDDHTAAYDVTGDGVVDMQDVLALFELI